MKAKKIKIPQIKISSYSDVTLLIERLIEWFTEWTHGTSDISDYITTGKRFNIHLHLDQGMFELDKVCNWLERNRPNLFRVVWQRRNEVKIQINKTDEAILLSESNSTARSKAQHLLITLNEDIIELIDILADTKNKLNQKVEGEWSTPMSKSKIATNLHLDNTYQLNKLINIGVYNVEQIDNNRQLWSIRLDTLDEKTREILKKQ